MFECAHSHYACIVTFTHLQLGKTQRCSVASFCWILMLPLHMAARIESNGTNHKLKLKLTTCAATGRATATNQCKVMSHDSYQKLVNRSQLVAHLMIYCITDQRQAGDCSMGGGSPWRHPSDLGAVLGRVPYNGVAFHNGSCSPLQLCL